MNTSLRERFNIDESNYSIASRIIADAIDLGLTKDYDPDNTSRRYKNTFKYGHNS
jgi:hypothetical protein